MPTFLDWITQTTEDICQFSIFQDGGRRHLGFLKFQIFNDRNDQEGRTASACQILSKSLEPRLRYNNFSIIPRWRPSTDAKRFCYLSYTICYSYGADNNEIEKMYLKLYLLQFFTSVSLLIASVKWNYCLFVTACTYHWCNKAHCDYCALEISY